MLMGATGASKVTISNSGRTSRRPRGVSGLALLRAAFLHEWERLARQRVPVPAVAVLGLPGCSFPAPFSLL